MELATGTRLGPYEIAGFIGAGAMGVVYRARDSRLGRDVAIKVLPPVFASDPDRLARFEREARAVAAINHPNIVSVHDIGNAEIVDAAQHPQRVTYLITELLDGETLRAYLAQGPLSARRSTDVAMQVARGLAAAHDRGIVHRDLKPENIVLLRDGQVKILDFGLAKQSASSLGSSDQQTMAATDAGTVLGTVGYMAPEQVRGEPADPRSDLFALGVVLFELGTGQRAFSRPTAAETMTAILREDPPEAAMAGLPPALARVVRHAIEKDPGSRFQSARDFAFALQAVTEPGSSGIAAQPDINLGKKEPRKRSEILAWVAAGALALTAAAQYWGAGASTVATSSKVVFSPMMPMRDATLFSPAVSPDGARVAFIARTKTGDSIVVRSLDASQSQPLKGTLGVRSGSMFWSPDGQSLAFCVGAKLKTIEVATAKIDEIADAPSCYGGAWSADGTILIAPDERSTIMRVSAKGGTLTAVTTLDVSHHEQAHRWPQFLPDGRHFIYMPWRSGTTVRKTMLGSLDGGAPKPLFDADTASVVAGNYFLFVRDLPSKLLAQAFNPRTYALEGSPVPVVDDDNIDYFWPAGDPNLSASAGTLVYTTGKLRLSQLTWFTRAGRPIGTLGEPDVIYDPSISPDGAALAVERRDSDHDTTDLWTIELARGVFSRLTSSPGYENAATWSPDGRRVAFSSDQDTEPKIFVKNANGTGAEDVLVDGRSFPTDWSHDGRYLLYMTDGGDTRQDIWLYDFQQRSSKAFLASPFNEYRARFSPDGKWIAYVSDEAQTPQIYVRSFPDGGTKIQISTAGGDVPQWRPDGRELFYLAPDSTLMAVDVHPNGASLGVGAPQALFTTNVTPDRMIRNPYTVAQDGQRFLLVLPVVPPGASPLVGVLNWQAGLSKK